MRPSLYVHIPFCKRKCNYCDFCSYEGKAELIPSYIEALKKESKYYSTKYNKSQLKTVFIGGGTPTYIDDGSIRELLNMINEDFTIDKDIEFTMEANPGTITETKLKLMKDLNVNRISLGVQSFNDKLLKRLGRIHKAKEAKEAYALIRAAGFKNINIDLMFALPEQSIKEWEKTLDEAIALKPEHISTYNLQIEEGTPFFAEKNAGKLIMPEQELDLEMFKMTISKLKKAGYVHYEISNFALPGYECEHNKTYWTLEPYIGIGAGAHSFIENSRVENTSDLTKYITSNPETIKTIHKNTKKESTQEMIFLNLRLLKGLSLENFTNKFGISFRELYRSEMAEMISENMLELKGKYIKLTEKGLFLANQVFKKFL